MGPGVAGAGQGVPRVYGAYTSARLVCRQILWVGIILQIAIDIFSNHLLGPLGFWSNSSRYRIFLAWTVLGPHHVKLDAEI